MNKPNTIKLIDFINKLGGKNHSRNNEEEKRIGQHAEEEEQNLQRYLGEKFRLDISKKPQQWQNSGHITTYFWIQLKELNYTKSPISISVFVEKYLNIKARFRVTIEYDYKYAEDNEIECFDIYKMLIQNGEAIPDTLNYFVCTDKKNESNYLIKEKNKEFLNQLYLSSRNEIDFYDSSLTRTNKKIIDKISRIQLSNIIKETKDNDVILEEIEKSISLLMPYYMKLIDGSDSSKKESKEKQNKSLPDFDCNEFSSTNTFSLRYIASLLAKPFVILTGNSGTGKTRIATQLASWLIKTTDTGITNSLVVPVGADWTDNTKILGYFNPLANNGTGDFIKSDVLTFIELAKDNPKIPFFLILDEMNLSHVERYFSDFLSAMESGKPILLYKKPENCESTVDETITLPKNLFVTGTVNIDETTYMFSPKVLDRANVIEVTPEKEDVLKIFSHKPEVQEIQPAPDGMAEAFVELAEKVRNFENGPLTDDGADLDGIFGNLYDILKPSGFEFAYRTTKEIVLYYCAAKSLNSELTTLEIIDHQIVQKILPKIHGNKKQIGELLNKLKEFLSKYEELDLSQKKISSMIDKLEKYQYASFI